MTFALRHDAFHEVAVAGDLAPAVREAKASCPAGDSTGPFAAACQRHDTH